MSQYTFQFAVLRYIHDPVTQEFLNVGVVVYSKEARYLKAQISTRYARLSAAFPGIDDTHYRRMASHIQRYLASIYSGFKQPELGAELPVKIEAILERVLPQDDSSLVFAGYGGGLTSDLDVTLDRLYERLVDRYAHKPEPSSRSDEQVWQVYSQELDKYHVTEHLASVTIQTPTYQYEFDHAWKNDRWHPIEPVSFDLVEAKSILEKANRWIGRGIMLADSENIGTLYLLLGEPRNERLQGAYDDAVQNMKAKIPLSLELISEREATAFSRRLARIIEQHQPPAPFDPEGVPPDQET